jgi:serpin B
MHRENFTFKAVAVAMLAGLLADGASPVSPSVFRADHPFVFSIRDTRLGSILFLGRLAAPSR